jgi:hypothetical protein
VLRSKGVAETGRTSFDDCAARSSTFISCRHDAHNSPNNENPADSLPGGSGILHAKHALGALRADDVLASVVSSTTDTESRSLGGVFAVRGFAAGGFIGDAVASNA